MITKKHLKQLGFEVQNIISWFGDSNTVKRREAILKLDSGNTLYIRGQQLFFIPASSSKNAPAYELWRNRHIGLTRTSFKQLRHIVQDCKKGVWLKWEMIASMQTDLNSNMWFGNASVYGITPAIENFGIIQYLSQSVK